MPHGILRSRYASRRMTRFILASASPRRLTLLAQIGITPDQVIPAEIDETPKKLEVPLDYVRRMAREKAVRVAANHTDALVLAADTVVACGRRILPKAETEKQARECLTLLSGRRHRVLTAVALSPPHIPPASGGDARGGIILRTVVTQVKFSRLSKADMNRYIESGEWQGKAGGYAIQGRAEAFIPWISGSYSNVVGLPLAETAAMLKSCGYYHT